jgi:rhodanese-related sulfurtransferase
VCALRNGTIGWTLAGLELEDKADRRFGPVSDADKSKSAATALALLFRAGVQRIDRDTLAQWQADTTRNTYVFDVRTPEEYAQGHWAGAISAPGGQLVQETDHHVGVRGARLVVYDDDGVRASLTASWLAQMGWEVAVLKDVKPQDLSHTDTPHLHPLPDTLEPVHEVDPATLKEWLANRSNLSMVIDVGDSATYVKRHIPGAWWLLRSQMAVHHVMPWPNSNRWCALAWKCCGCPAAMRLGWRKASAPNKASRMWPAHASTATADLTKAPTTPRKPCRLTWIGNTVWWNNCAAMAHTISR